MQIKTVPFPLSSPIIHCSSFMGFPQPTRQPNLDCHRNMENYSPLIYWSLPIPGANRSRAGTLCRAWDPRGPVEERDGSRWALHQAVVVMEAVRQFSYFLPSSGHVVGLNFSALLKLGITTWLNRLGRRVCPTQEPGWWLVGQLVIWHLRQGSDMISSAFQKYYSGNYGR